MSALYRSGRIIHLMYKTGIYPGAFDPLHQGHIAFAREAIKVCGLDEVVFLPERLPRGKDNVTGLTERVALLREGLSGEGLRVAQLASDRFTVKDTLPELLEMFAGSELTLLLGSDIALTLTYRWEGLEILLASVSLAIGMRGDDSPDEIAGIITALEKEYGLAVTHTIVQTEHAGLASSQIRLGQLTAEA